MFCQECGAFVNQGEKFCRSCGKPVNVPTELIGQQMQQPVQQPMQQPVQQPMMQPQVQQLMVNEYGQPIQQPVNEYGQPINYGQPMSQNLSNDIVLENIFMGTEYNSFRSGGFSLCSFFFGAMYALCRKMWLLGLAWYILSLILSLFLPLFSVLLMIVFNVVVAINFKKWYVQHAKDKVAQIKAENSGASFEQLKAICARKGGVTYIPLIIFLVFCVAVFVFLFFVLYSAVQYSIDYDTQIVEKEVVNDNKIGNLSLEVPDGFESVNENESSFRIYSYNADGNNCKLTVNLLSTTRYSSSDEYLQKGVTYSGSDIVSPLETKTLNGTDWAYMSVQKPSSIIYYYALLEHNNKVYDVKFEIKEDNGVCSQSYTDVTNSLTIK